MKKQNGRKTMALQKNKTLLVESDSDKESYWSSKPLTPASHLHNHNCDHEVNEKDIEKLIHNDPV